MHSFTLRITENHLEKALRDMQERRVDNYVCEHCVVAQAVREVMDSAWVAEYAIVKRPSIGAEFTNDEWQGDHNAQQLVRLWDNEKFDELREMLPVEVTFRPYSYLLENK